MRILAVTTLRNEAPFIVEWVAHMRAIGVTDLLVYTNDCDDGTDALLAGIGQTWDLASHNPGRAPGGEPAMAGAQSGLAASIAQGLRLGCGL